MPQRSPSRLQAILIALFVTLLWSSSWVLIKIGLKDIPALTFAGLRYALAFLSLLPFALRREQRAALRQLNRADWGWLLVLGVFYYALVQGTQFLGLSYLPSVTVSLMLNLTAALVTLLAIGMLREIPTPLQWVGVILNMAGLFIYFYPISFAAGQATGLVIMTVGVLANAFSAVLGRRINRAGRIPVLLVTVISMGIGSLLMLVTGLIWQGLPPLSLQAWLMILFMAVVNTALAFTLWNYTLRTLSAMESSVINGTMLVQIALLAWLFLGETLTPRQLLGMVVAGGAALLVQLAAKPASGH